MAERLRKPRRMRSKLTDQKIRTTPREEIDFVTVDGEEVSFIPLNKDGVATNPRGRPKGSKNRIQREIREALLEAGHLAGYDIVVERLYDEAVAKHRELNNGEEPPSQTRGVLMRKAKEFAHGNLVDYFREQSHKNPTAFMSTIAKILPKQIDVNLQLTSREIVDTMAHRRNILAAQKAGALELVEDVDYHAEAAE